jgi:hypothetical protein
VEHRVERALRDRGERIFERTIRSHFDAATTGSPRWANVIPELRRLPASIRWRAPARRRR